MIGGISIIVLEQLMDITTFDTTEFCLGSLVFPFVFLDLRIQILNYI